MFHQQAHKRNVAIAGCEIEGRCAGERQVMAAQMNQRWIARRAAFIEHAFLDAHPGVWIGAVVKQNLRQFERA